MKKILVLNFFPAFTPPSSGGELRYYNIYEKLSSYYDITLLSPTYPHYKEEVVEHTKTLREFRIPKENIHHLLSLELEKEIIEAEISALVCALSARYPNKYHRMYLELYPESELIIHDSPYMLEYDLFFGFDDKPRIYNSYNYETVLMSQIWSGSNAQKYIDYIYNLEKRLVVKSELVFATSEADQKAFIHDFQTDADKIKIASNGINPDEWKNVRMPGRSERMKAFFIGSAHPPNIEAVDFIIHKLSAKCPGIDFYIAGLCCEAFQGSEHPNVFLLGKIDEKQKKDLFRTAGIAINPMFSGSGTNLKTLEFLSAGLPLISTRMGVRGFDLVDGEHGILAEKDEFAERLNFIIGDSTGLAKIARKGQEYINTHYSWANIAKTIHTELEKIGFEKNKNVVLLLNDFEVSHPCSGGEIRINKLYGHLSEYYRILLFCLNNDGIIKHTEITDNFVEISFPKTSEHLQKESNMHSRFWLSVEDIVSSEMCTKNDLLVRTLACIEQKVHAVIFSHPYLSPLVETLLNPNIIYESLNCEYELKTSLLKEHPDFKRLIEQVTTIEKRIAEKSRCIVIVSDDDHDCLTKLITSVGKEIFTIPNGVSIHEKNLTQDYPIVKEGFKNHPVIVFIGSGHKPNFEAVQFIIDRLSSELSNCCFVIIGTVCEYFVERCITPPSNVLFFGKLPEEYKDILLGVADIAINPMFSGSGSNLKLAEYFAHKIPTVTTPFGSRGYAIENRQEAVICEGQEFSEKISELLHNENLRVTLVANAFSYVKKNLEWRVLAKRFQQILCRMCSAQC